MSAGYTKFVDELDYDSEPPAYCSEKSVVVKQPMTVEPMGTVIHPKAGWTICCSVFTLCCCFTPLGIAALVFAVMSTTHKDYETAKNQLRMSRKLNWISVVVGLVLLLLVALYYYWFVTQVMIPAQEAQAQQWAKTDYVYENQRAAQQPEYEPRQMP